MIESVIAYKGYKPVRYENHQDGNVVDIVITEQHGRELNVIGFGLKKSEKETTKERRL
jgi:hypothetical protein